MAFRSTPRTGSDASREPRALRRGVLRDQRARNLLLKGDDRLPVPLELGRDAGLPELLAFA